jgi:transcriptional regulator with XRE-family HTH domain
VTDFPARLRRLRQEQGLTRYRLAKLSGLSKEGVCNLEEPGADPKLSTLVKLAAALGVPVCDLLSCREAAGRSGGQP